MTVGEGRDFVSGGFHEQDQFSFRFRVARKRDLQAVVTFGGMHGFAFLLRDRRERPTIVQ